MIARLGESSARFRFAAEQVVLENRQTYAILKLVDKNGNMRVAKTARLEVTLRESRASAFAN
jgi:hypothetical protein